MWLDKFKNLINQKKTAKFLVIEDLTRPNFKGSEFIFSKTAFEKNIDNTPNQSQLIAGMMLADKMQELHTALSRLLKTKVKIIISSGFRSEKLNKAINGAPNSYHKKFLACDFIIDGLSPKEGVEAIKKTKVSINNCFVEKNCIHLDIEHPASKNKNFYGSAFKDEDGNWQVINKIKDV